jgi:hypothetical protein
LRKNKNNLHRPYLIISLVFAGIILSVILYSLAFSPDTTRHPVPSGSQWLSGEATVSMGLSRSFSSIVRFDYESARRHNPFGIRIFAFFLVQLLMRLVAIFVVIRSVSWVRGYAWADVVATGCLFLVAFYPFIVEMINQL